MSYTALYRKFRPETFTQVKGQDHIVTTLRNQLRTGRVGHAYLFCGTRGTGKTSVAKILARAVNCENLEDGDPCGVCPMCRGIREGSLMNVVEIDAASNNGVDNIRDIREEIDYRPTRGRYKVYIIDEVHMLSTSAFNALLKTLEEPPEYVIFILATTEAQKIPATILSRCQRYDFHRISLDVITARLMDLLAREGVDAQEKAVRYVARLGDGSMRDALSLLDRCIAFYMGETLTYEKVLDILGAVDTETFSHMLRGILKGDVVGVIRLLEELTTAGRELGQFTNDFTWYLRNLLLVKTSEHPEDAVDASAENLALMKEESALVDMEILMRYIRVLSDLSASLRNAVQKRVLVETALIRLCRPAMETDLSSVLDRVRVLEQQIEELQERPAVQIPPSGGGVSASGSLPEERGIPAVPLARAPEELQKVIEERNWKAIVSLTTGSLRAILQNSGRGFQTQTPDGALYILVKDSVSGLYHVDNPQSEEEMRSAIRQVTGLDVAVRFVRSKEAPAGVACSPEQVLREEINFEVETEDE